MHNYANLKLILMKLTGDLPEEKKMEKTAIEIVGKITNKDINDYVQKSFKKEEKKFKKQKKNASFLILFLKSLYTEIRDKRLLKKSKEIETAIERKEEKLNKIIEKHKKGKMILKNLAEAKTFEEQGRIRKELRIHLNS